MLYVEFPSHDAISFASAGQFVAQECPVHPRRRLDSHVLLVGCRGEYPIAQDGRKHVLSEKSFLLLPAGLEHGGFAPASENQSHFWCHFHSNVVLTEADMQPQRNGIILPEFGRIAHAEKYMLLFRQMVDAEYRPYAEAQTGRQIANYFLSIILMELADECRQVTSGEKGLLLVHKVEEWIRQHACEGVRPADVAAQFGYTTDYLSQLLRAATGQSIDRHLLSRRLREAKHLLLQTALPIHEVARLAGFRDCKYFMRVFHRAENLTPTEYRQSCNHLHINSR